MAHDPKATVDSLVALAEATPIGLRGVEGVVGGLLLVAGSRLYKLAILAPGIVAGILVGGWLPLALSDGARVGVIVVLALIGALVCNFVERLAIHLVGVIVAAGITHAMWPLVAGDPAPWWGTAAGGLVGILLFPTAFKMLLPWVTSALGALLVAYAGGFSDKILWIAGLTVAGAIVQIAVTGRKQKGSEKD